MKQLQALIPETAEEKRNHDMTHNFVTEDGRITEAGEALVDLAFEVLAKACFQNAKVHGWYEDYIYIVDDDYAGSREALEPRPFPEIIALWHSEVAEAFEAFRDGDNPQDITYTDKKTGWKWEGPQTLTSNETGEETIGKPEGITAETADILIRIFDWVGAMKAAGQPVPLATATIQKHLYNFTRPYRHGGKKA